MRVLAIIPARGGSKGIPGKNIKTLGGLPLIAHTITAAVESKYVSDIVVSTDDPEIGAVAEEFGVPWKRRDKNYADDQTPLIPNVIYYVLRQMDSTYDIVLILEPTYPFRSSETIDEVIKKVHEGSSDWVVTLSPTRDHPHRCRILVDGKVEPVINSDNIFKQRQDLPDTYMMRGAVYGTTPKCILKQTPLNDASWGGVVVSSKEGVDIDEPLDFLLAQTIIDEDK
tara:strand:+ start:2668 stop:3345 length:678 start_codon:yes stop_codon:yes gene_type:complete